MTDDPVPPEVRSFLYACINSVAELEALLLLRGTPDQAWVSAELGRRLYVEESEAAQILASLAACELAIQTGSNFRYHVSGSERRQLVDRLAESYARSLVPVTKIIHDKGTGIRSFAEAFKLWKDT